MITIIFGTRPEIIKLFPFIKLLQSKNLKFNLVHTGQHYSDDLSKVFINQLKIPKKKIFNLNVGSYSHAKQTSLMTIKIENYLIKKKNVKEVIVYGDTNSALSGALATTKFQNIKLIHFEAGLRSFDKGMPEEINRRIIDHCSDLLICPTKLSKQFLINEGINKKKIFVTGNTIVDTIKSGLVKQNIKFLSNELKNKKYGLLTIHREENTLNGNNLKKILSSVTSIAIKKRFDFIFPIHPKTRKILNKIKIRTNRIKFTSPMNYFDFLAYLKNAKLIISDSGGVQEEACILKTPLITVRNSTERQETLKIGCNILCKINNDNLTKKANLILKRKIRWQNPYGSGNASPKILNILKKFSKKNETKFF